MKDENLQYPIGKEETQEYFAADFNEPLKLLLLTDIKDLPSSLDKAIQDLDAEQLDTPFRPGGWTVRQLIHHVADSHINAYTRFKLGLTENNPTIKPYDQEAWASLSDSKTELVIISSLLLHSLHTRWYALMNEMSEEQWQRTIYHPERKVKITLWELLKSYAWHGKHHTAHITKLRERMNWN
ncbi:MAG TPA: putative metal-dependent hydrolase [Chitinophagaceae bacterium]|nr:putative metal-dependent hydrolase [Hanamia sp.]